RPHTRSDRDWSSYVCSSDLDPSLYQYHQILAWALAALAHAGDGWFDLADFVAQVLDQQGRQTDYDFHLGGEYAWNPDLPQARSLIGRASCRVIKAYVVYAST